MHACLTARLESACRTGWHRSTRSIRQTARSDQRRPGITRRCGRQRADPIGRRDRRLDDSRPWIGPRAEAASSRAAGQARSGSAGNWATLSSPQPRITAGDRRSSRYRQESHRASLPSASGPRAIPLDRRREADGGRSRLRGQRSPRICLRQIVIVGAWPSRIRDRRPCACGVTEDHAEQSGDAYEGWEGEQHVMQCRSIRRSGHPHVPRMVECELLDRDLIRGGHYGQRSERALADQQAERHRPHRRPAAQREESPLPTGSRLTHGTSGTNGLGWRSPCQNRDLMAKLPPDLCPIAPIHRSPDASRNSEILGGRAVSRAGHRVLQFPATRIALSAYGRGHVRDVRERHQTCR